MKVPEILKDCIPNPVVRLGSFQRKNGAAGCCVILSAVIADYP
jgi:hypothetical protein